jgi:hypothetical protein
MAEPDALFDLPLGEELARRGMAQAASSERAWVWGRDAEAAIRQLAASGVPFTADDLIRLVGLPSWGVNRNNAVGALFTSAAKRGLIVRTGHYRKSRRALSHGRMIAVWVGVEGPLPEVALWDAP